MSLIGSSGSNTMLAPLATMVMALVAYVSGQASQDMKRTGQIDSSFMLTQKIDNVTYLQQLENDLVLPNMDISILYQGLQQRGGRDEQLSYPFNPLRVREIMECKETIKKEKSIVDQAALGDAILQSYLEQRLRPNVSGYKPFYIGVGEGAASLLATDEMVKDDADVLPLLMTLGLFNGEEAEGDLDDDVVVGFVLASPNEDCRHPHLAVKQEVVQDGMTDSEGMMAKLAVTERDPTWPLEVLPTFVLHNHVENHQSGVVTIGASKISDEPWFPKLPPFYQLILCNLHDRESVVTQLHEYTKIAYLLPYCECGSTWYQFGQQIPTTDVCKVCVCGPEYQRRGEDSCYPKECSWDTNRAAYIQQGCSAIYHNGLCCPDVDCPGQPLLEDSKSKRDERNELYDSAEPDSESLRERLNYIKRMEHIKRLLPNAIIA